MQSVDGDGELRSGSHHHWSAVGKNPLAKATKDKALRKVMVGESSGRQMGLSNIFWRTAFCSSADLVSFRKLWLNAVAAVIGQTRDEAGKRRVWISLAVCLGWITGWSPA